MTTAAHCWSVGSVVRTPTGRLFGAVVQRGTLNSWWFFDNRDVELIGGQSYAPRVYTGGVTSTSSKAVVGASDPVAGVTGYCTSGQTTGEQCNQTVQSTGAIVCTQTGCKWPVIQYARRPVAARRLRRLDVPPRRHRPGVRARLGHRRQRHDELRGAVEPHVVRHGRVDRPSRGAGGGPAVPPLTRRPRPGASCAARSALRGESCA